jgi:hypothetical protein
MLNNRDNASEARAKNVLGAHECRDIALVSQMRAGTHYMSAALRIALEAPLLRPRADGQYVVMEDSEILDNMHQENIAALPPSRSGRKIYFSHYYHPHHESLPPMPRISLIGFPLDSFYSDGIVFSDKTYSARPSGSRPHASNYVFRRDSAEWRKLEEYMCKNACWLEEISAGPDNLIVRYEDLYNDFDSVTASIECHVGEFANPMPKPVINRNRTYWTHEFASKFDAPALAALLDIFGPAMNRYYPECIAALQKT